ncbi:hypothetical protein [Paraburkholderia tropica]|uniref:hypothetical protein n=1 Tax=Paraburkholderia tropica TaxID=92647 RepID=UPI002AB710BA|nr:hypothetical protein [Paraburkholderia tropica]
MAMEDQLRIRAVAVTAAALTILPGSAFAFPTAAAIDRSVASYLPQFGTVQAQPGIVLQDPMIQIGSPLQGTHVNALVVSPASEDDYFGAMLRVAHALASESQDIDAEIAQMVDEEFWDLI